MVNQNWHQIISRGSTLTRTSIEPVKPVNLCEGCYCGRRLEFGGETRTKTEGCKVNPKICSRGNLDFHLHL